MICYDVSVTGGREEAIGGGMVTMQEPAVITIAEAAQLANMTRNGLRWHVDRGRIAVIGTPYGRAIVRASLEEFLARRAERQSKTPERDS